MFDLFSRALLSPIDYSGALWRRTLTLREIIQEADSVYSFIFVPEKPLSWKAGQHGLFFLPGKNVSGKTWRAFSIASSPDEGVVRISTVFPPQPSDFKQKLRTLVPGEKVHLFGPFGEFHIDKCGQKIVGIAGGIGITPFRSLILRAATTCKDIDLTLIYGGRNGVHFFKNELDEVAKHHPNLRISYVTTPEEVTRAIEHEVAEKGNTAEYFVSGSPPMIAGITKTLRENGIKKIVNDPFKGY